VSGIDSPKLRRRLLLGAGVAAFLVFLYFTALPNTFPADSDGDSGRDGSLAGTYTINGVDHLGTEYSGTVTIVDGPSPDRYEIEWVVTGAIQQGTGLLEGQTLTADWASVASAAPGSGRTVYTIADDGALVGQRFVDGVTEPGTETLFPDP
jgi:hypothetical protein